MPEQHLNGPNAGFPVRAKGVRLIVLSLCLGIGLALSFLPSGRHLLDGSRAKPGSPHYFDRAEVGKRTLDALQLMTGNARYNKHYGQPMSAETSPGQEPEAYLVLSNFNRDLWSRTTLAVVQITSPAASANPVSPQAFRDYADLFQAVNAKAPASGRQKPHFQSLVCASVKNVLLQNGRTLPLCQARGSVAEGVETPGVFAVIPKANGKTILLLSFPWQDDQEAVRRDRLKALNIPNYQEKMNRFLEDNLTNFIAHSGLDQQLDAK